MTSDRPYRKALPLEAVVVGDPPYSGTQFDPRCACARCCALLEREGEASSRRTRSSTSTRSSRAEDAPAQRPPIAPRRAGARLRPDDRARRDPRVLLDPRFLAALHDELRRARSATPTRPRRAAPDRRAARAPGRRARASRRTRRRSAPTLAAPLAMPLRMPCRSQQRGAPGASCDRGTGPSAHEAAARARARRWARTAPPAISERRLHVGLALRALRRRLRRGRDECCGATGRGACRFVARESRGLATRGDPALRCALASCRWRPAAASCASARAAARARPAVEPPGLRRDRARRRRVHVWGPVMVMPYGGPEEALARSSWSRATRGAGERQRGRGRPRAARSSTTPSARSRSSARGTRRGLGRRGGASPTSRRSRSARSPASSTRRCWSRRTSRTAVAPPSRSPASQRCRA